MRGRERVNYFISVPRAETSEIDGMVCVWNRLERKRDSVYQRSEHVKKDNGRLANVAFYKGNE